MIDGKKVAFVFSAGAALGAIEVGMLKSLSERGIEADAVYGTSVGAVNAAGYALLGETGLEKIWSSITGWSSVFSFNWSSLFLCSDGFFNLKPLKKILSSFTGQVPRCPVTICSVDLATGGIVYSKFGDSNYIDSLAASAAIPGTVSPTNGQVDGTIRQKVPLSLAIEDGAEIIYCFLSRPYTDDGLFGTWKPKTRFLQMFQVGYRSLEILCLNTLVSDIQTCIAYNLKPDVDHSKLIDLRVIAPTQSFDSLDFSVSNIAAMIDHGYGVAKTTYPN